MVTLKLKRANHAVLTRRHALRTPTQLADTLYREVRGLYDRAGDPGPFRLIGVGLSDLVLAAAADMTEDLLDPAARKRAAAERAADRIRARFGAEAIMKGRALR